MNRSCALYPFSKTSNRVDITITTRGEQIWQRVEEEATMAPKKLATRLHTHALLLRHHARSEILTTVCL